MVRQSKYKEYRDKEGMYRGAVISADDVLFSVREFARHRSLRKALQKCGVRNLSTEQLDFLWYDDMGERSRLMGVPPRCWDEFNKSIKDFIEPEDISFREGVQEFLHQFAGTRYIDDEYVDFGGKVLLVFYSPKGVEQVVLDILLKDKRLRSRIAMVDGVHCSYRNGAVEGKPLSRLMDKAINEFGMPGDHIVHINYLKRGMHDARGHNMLFVSFDPENASGSKTRYQLTPVNSLYKLLEKINVADVFRDDAAKEDKGCSSGSKQ